MRISVTPFCHHEDGWTSDGEAIVGKRIQVDPEGVWLDGVWIIKRDRRAKRLRSPGHDWLTKNGQTDPSYSNIGWTGFRVQVEPEVRA